MIERFIRFMCGYLYIYIPGSAATRFINLCNGKDMLLWGICRKDDAIWCYISLKNYKDVHPFARKCRVVPYIKRRYGFPFIINRVKKRKILLNAAVLFGALIYIMSLYIWNIEFEGNYLHTDEQMINFLTEMDISIGSKKSIIDCSYIEDMIRKNYPDIGWVSVELKGTRLYARFEETTIPTPARAFKETNLETGHLIASRDGIIQSIIVRAGTIKVKTGDIVRKGDILVSGIIEIIGDDQIVSAAHEVLADADIMMKTTEIYSDSFSMSYEKKLYTEFEKSGYDVYAFGRKILSHYPSNSYLNYDIIAEENTLRVNENFYLPLYYRKVTYKEYTLEQMIYTKEEADAIANKRLLRYLENLKSKGIEVLSCDTNMKIENGNCITTGRIQMRESAYEYCEILYSGQ